MKPEAFDEAIRKKLEGIGQSYTDADIDQVFRHVAKPKPSFFRWLKGKWFIASISGLVVIVAVTVLLTEKLTPPGTTEDTGSIIVPGENRSQQEAARVGKQVPGESLSRNPGQVPLNQPEPVVPGPEPPAIVQREAFVTASAFTNEVPKQQPEVAIPVIATEEPAVANPGSVKTGMQEESPVMAGQQAGKQPGEPSGIQPSVLPDQQEVPPVSLPGSKPVEEEGLLQKEPVQKKKISWGYQVSAAPFFSNQALGAGISGGLTAGKHLGFSAGIRYFRTYPETFRDREDLDRSKHHRMHPRIEEGFREDDKFRDIVMKNELLQAPLRITYRLPLKRGLEVSFGVGTDLDFYLNQRVELRLQEDSAGRPRRPFQARGEISPLNNLVLTAGIRKQWNRFSVYLSPYISPSLKEVFYKPKEMEAGGEVGILFDLH